MKNSIFNYTVLSAGSALCISGFMAVSASWNPAEAANNRCRLDADGNGSRACQCYVLQNGLANAMILDQLSSMRVCGATGISSNSAVTIPVREYRCGGYGYSEHDSSNWSRSESRGSWRSTANK